MRKGVCTGRAQGAEEQESTEKMQSFQQMADLLFYLMLKSHLKDEDQWHSGIRPAE